VGNENWGGGGNMRPEYYADLYRRYQTFVRQYGPDKIYKIACGSQDSQFEWTKVVMREAGALMDGLSLHHYSLEQGWHGKKPAADFDESGWFKILKSAFSMDDIIRRHGEIMDAYDSEKRVGMVVDEWGSWYAVEPGSNPGFLYQQNTLRDALIAGITLNIFNDHADRVRIANLAQAVNVLQSPVLTEGDKTILTPTWHVFDMYASHQGAELLNTAIASPRYYLGEENLPCVSGTASLSTQGFYTITLCNIHPEQSQELDITLNGGEQHINRLEGTVLTADAMNAMNTFEKPETVRPKTLTLHTAEKNHIRCTAPAKSVLSIRVYPAAN
jgi:alpha-N-arabinofuranosidase